MITNLKFQKPAPLIPLHSGQWISWCLICTDVAWSRQREQTQTEGMSHSLLRPGFSFPRLEAISLSWPTSSQSRRQLMPTNLAHVLWYPAFAGWMWLKQRQYSYRWLCYYWYAFFGIFFFCNRKNNVIFLLFQYDLAPLTSMISFITTLLLMLQAYCPSLLFLKHGYISMSLHVSIWNYSLLMPLSSRYFHPLLQVSLQKSPYWRLFPRPYYVKC